MRKITSIAMAVVISLSGLTACKTVKPQSIENKARGIAYLVAAESLLQHPEWTPHFETASAQFEVLSKTENINILMINQLIARLPVKELKGKQAAIVVTAGVLFLQDDLGEISVDQPEQLRRAAKGAHEGIELALGL